MTEITTPSAAASLPGDLPASRPGLILRHTLRDNLGGMLGWGLAYGALVIVISLLYPLLDESNTLFTVVSGLGILDTLTAGRNLADITSFGGYLALEVMTWGPLILAIYVIPQTLNAVSNEERQGRLDILLSTPISRWRYLVEKTLAILLSLLGILAVIWLCLLFGVTFLAQQEMSLEQTIAGVWHMFPMLSVILTATLLFSVTLRNSRHAASAATLLIVASYFVRILNDLVDSPLLLSLREFSPYYYYRSVDALTQGFQFHLDIVLLTAAGILFLLAVLAFQRRDLVV